MKIIIRNLQKKIPVYPARIKKAVLKVLASEGNSLNGEITVSFVNDKAIKRLNEKYHFTNQPTDVLAFDDSSSLKPKELIADIVISTDTAARQAREFKTTVAFELNLYVIHGLLHLLGYTDLNAKALKVMRLKEAKYLKML